MTDTTTVRHEVEVDTRIYAAYVEYADAAMDEYRAEAALESAEKWAERRPAFASDVARARQALAAAVAKREAAWAAYTETEREYEGWSRFYLVQNANGHIHSTMACSTCNPRTRFAWLVDVSGLTEAEAVAAHGERMCTTCYPSAPSAWTQGYYERVTREAREAKAAERAEKAAAKAAKQAARRAVYHYGIRFYRASDGAVIDHFRNYRGEVEYTSAKTLKSAQREVAESGGYNGRYVVVDLDTETEVA